MSRKSMEESLKRCKVGVRAKDGGRLARTAPPPVPATKTAFQWTELARPWPICKAHRGRVLFLTFAPQLLVAAPEPGAGSQVAF
jgi:hypothetical protein